ncbi:MAG TPA: AMP-binding protein [Solirubrobacterales bacterium]|nr:AMP-binding protein [Solirubrobacterales bacterium]
MTEHTVTLRGERVELPTVRDLVVARAELGDKVLMVSREEELTYREADLRSNRIANSLLALGIEPGDVVSTFMYNSIDHAAFWFGCAKLGVIWAPLNISLRGDDLAWTVGNTQAKLVVVEAELLEHFLEVRGDLPGVEIEVLWNDDEAAAAQSMVPFSKLLEGDDLLPDAEVTATTPHAITYTGGSTGMPKGVLVSNLHHIAAAMRFREVAQPTPADVHMPFGQLFHGSGQQNGLLGPMYCEMTTIMPRWFSASRYWELVKRYGVTTVDPIGPIMIALLAQPPSDYDRGHSVRVAIGSACGQIAPERRDEFEERFGIPLHEQFSQTETGVVMISETPDDRRKGSSGKGRGWAEVSIRDEDDFPLSAGEIGEIALRPSEPHVFMIGYFDNAKATAESWRNMWHHTGDLGYLDEDGYLFFIGRQAHWMRRKGENVSSYEVERALDLHPDVVEAAVVGVPSDMGDEDIKGYVVIADRAEFDPDALVEWCEERLAYFKVPRYLEQIEVLPRSAAKGDPDRTKLRERGAGDAWDRTAQAGATS